MPLVPTRLLIINRQLEFAVTVKKSLEQIGGYEVAAFTSPEAAIEYLHHRPHDVMLVDFGVRGMTGIEVIMKARALQPDIAVIASPRTPEIQRAAQEFALQDVVDTPLPIRQLVTVIKNAVQSARQSLLPDTTEAPSLRISPPSLNEGDSHTLRVRPPAFPPLETLPEQGIIENRTETIEVDMSDMSITQAQASRSVSIFDQLAAEEPPLPDIEEGATVRDFQVHLERDLRDSLLDSGERVVVELLSTDLPLVAPKPLPVDDGDEPDEPILARKILEGTLDHTSSIKALVEQVAPESQMIETAATLDQTPVDTEAQERDLEQLTVDLVQASLESTAEATILSRGHEIIASAGNLAPEDLDELRVTVTGTWKSNETQSRLRFVTLRSNGRDYMLFSRRIDLSDATDISPEDRVLTMVFAGNMPLRVIRRQSDKLLAALRQVPDIASPVEAESEPQVELTAEPEYVETTSDAEIYEALAEDHTVEAAEAAFLEEAYIPVIRSDSQVILPFDEPRYPLHVSTTADLSHVETDARLINPDMPPIPAAKPIPKVVLSPYTYIWLMRDSGQSISNAVAQAIVAGLDLKLTERGWTINTLRVHEDYIYLYGQMPDDRPANDIIAELKQISAEIATAKDAKLNSEDLWADSYLALYPGRELEAEEVQRFIDFGRAG